MILTLTGAAHEAKEQQLSPPAAPSTAAIFSPIF